MNKIKTLLITTAVALLAATGAQAQTNTTPEQNFFLTAAGYLTSFNTNLLFTADTVDLWTAPETQQGVGIDDALGVRWNAWRPSTATVVGVGALIRNAGVAGTVVGVGPELSLGVVKYDTKLLFGIGGGDNLTLKSAYVEPFIEVDKLITANTYAGLRLSYDFFTKAGISNQSAPIVGIVLGCTF
jgi:hypothetical protein